MKRLLLVAALLLPVAVPALATSAAGTADSAHGIAPPPHRAPQGVLRIWGHPGAGAWLERVGVGFASIHPDIEIRSQLSGSDVGMAALYTGQADIVLMGREATESEVKAFEWIHRYRPTAVPLMTGSLDQPGQAPALVVFVHRDNPLQSLDLAQLDGIVGTARDNGWRDNQAVAEAGRSEDADIRQWDELGLGGEWAGQPIRLHVPMAESGTGKFLRTKLIADSNRMHWGAITEHADLVGGPEDSGRRIGEAVASDRYALGIANLKYQDPALKVVPIAWASGMPAVLPTAASLMDERYALGRTGYAYINLHPVDGVDPNVRAWLVQALSRADSGAPSSGFLPLHEARRASSLELLGPEPSRTREESGSKVAPP